MLKTKNDVSLYYIIGLALIAVAGIYFTWKYIMPQYALNKQKLGSYEAEIQSAETTFASFSIAKQNYEQAKPTVDDVFVAMPADNDVPNLISELEKIAQRYGTYLPSIQISDGTSNASRTSATTSTASTSGSNAVNVAFSVNGSVDSMQGFVRALENDLKIFNIKSMNVTYTAGSLSLSLQMETYKMSGAVRQNMASVVAPVISNSAGGTQ